VADLVDPPAANVITYIPPDPVRQLKRSTHPAEGLSRELARLWSLEHACLLDRSRSVSRQAAQRFAARRGNVQGAFAAAGPAPRRVLLVDDIYTTGATVSAAATALRRAGAVRVDVITFARAVR
jgi:predicted amidophosphoribosyltransferase